jgi:hypothetical protein
MGQLLSLTPSLGVADDPESVLPVELDHGVPHSWEQAYGVVVAIEDPQHLSCDGGLFEVYVLQDAEDATDRAARLAERVERGSDKVVQDQVRVLSAEPLEGLARPLRTSPDGIAEGVVEVEEYGAQDHWHPSSKLMT